MEACVALDSTDEGIAGGKQTRPTRSAWGEEEVVEAGPFGREVMTVMG